MDSFKKFWDDASTKLKGAMDDNEKLDALLSDAKGKFAELTSDEPQRVAVRRVA